jgi:hypothetical protein
MNLQVVADGRHSVPTVIDINVDGAVREVSLPAIADRQAENATTTVPLHFPAMTGRSIRVEIVSTRARMATRESTGDDVTAPVGIAEVGIPGLRTASVPTTVLQRCRADLLSIDAKTIPVRVSGSSTAAGNLSGLVFNACDPRDPGRVPTITLGAGNHVVRTSEGIRTGMQLDRVVLTSAAGVPVALTAPPPKVTVVHDGATRMRVHVTGADAPFWLVLGESQSPGWKATVAPAGSASGSRSGSLGSSRLVDGYANGWMVTPTKSSFDVVLEWTPQRRVGAAIWISLVAALLCLALIAWSLVRGRARVRDLRSSPSDSDVRLEWPSRARGTLALTRRSRVVVPILAGLVASLVVAPWAGALAALAVVLIQWRPSLRVIVAVTPAALLAAVAFYMVYLQHTFRFPAVFEWPTLFPLGRPLGWLAVVFLGVDVLVERVRTSPEGAAAGERSAER